MKNIRVLHTEWSDGWGGQEIRTIGEMEALREKGVQLFLACKDNAKIKEKALEKGFKVFTLDFRSNTDFKTLFALIKIIKKEKIDIVNTHSGKDTWVGGLAAKFTGAKFIRTRHLSNPVNASKLNFINSLADYIMTTGESVRQAMIQENKVDPNKIKSVPTGIDDTLFDPSKYNKAEEREKLGIKENEIAIGILAVLRGFKRHDIFLEMAKKLTLKYPEATFLIAGTGPGETRIRKMIEDMKLTERVRMIGHTDEPARFLSALDIFTLTSDSSEGVPQSVMQALMMQLPVIATNVGSTKDLLNNDNFILIEPKNVDILVEQMEKLIQDKELRSNYSQKARAYIVNNFSRKVMAKNIQHIYNTLLQKD
ncbi:MAG: WalR protein [Epsilonproteobacteria bacterium (ex Lamellibrachia satsuma)]|nr:MAG: WalR protein [Epsilonproteobacteria bacterium (ex Lamellibrachia satsuma)]